MYHPWTDRAGWEPLKNIPEYAEGRLTNYKQHYFKKDRNIALCHALEWSKNRTKTHSRDLNRVCKNCLRILKARKKRRR